ncbi:hypothetical protein SeMB42_g02735 [Synchytrium endobioticum]|uniref:F-actin-capping protein subunit alpha n=1 Tax=Synchytrium endobioticum TaxID=286115 RepID=A0A507DBT7_9FUNG|nr:hypothetical protein SeLEV6574_g05251 [Synchytrium endobioticum]TPX49112.1 hypothetical protein SeMB42_g02735 [Synchytrium endobioticum]
MTDKVKIASSFLLDSPPGEVNDVFNDIRTLVSDDASLQEGIGSAFEAYNTEQLTTATIPGVNHPVIISKYGEKPGRVYQDPRSGYSFTFDHIQRTVGDVTRDSPDTNSYRLAMDDALQQYVSQHYPDGACAVYHVPSTGYLHLAIVDSRYNPNNFWNGRWRSCYAIAMGGNELRGLLKLQVHYYEDGNVQLNTEKEIVADVASGNDERTFANGVIKQILKIENDFQSVLNENYAQLSDSTFKALRRALPVTRNRIDWNAIGGYRIGSELTASAGSK